MKQNLNLKQNWMITFTFILTIFTVFAGELQAQPTSLANVELVGNAVEIETNEYKLTSDAMNQMGAIWSQSYVDMNKDFSIQASLFFGHKDATGADGIAFVLQPNCTGAGTVGHGIGYGNINPSFAIEFDTWQNTNNNDPASDHIGFQTNGSPVHGSNSTISVGNLENGLFHELTLSWTAATKVWTINFAGQNLTKTFPWFNDASSPRTFLFWGFTSSTGGSSNEHKVRINSITQDNINPYTVIGATGPNQTDGQITMDMLGDNVGVEFSFNEGDFSSNNVMDNLTEGVYTVVAKDQNECKSTFTIDVPFRSRNCKTNFHYSSQPTRVTGSNNREIQGSINDVTYTFTSDQPIVLADFSGTSPIPSGYEAGHKGTKSSMLNTIYPNLASVSGDELILDASVLSSAVQVRNSRVSNNTITFSQAINNPVLYFTSIGDRSRSVPIEFTQAVRLIGKHGAVEISSDGTTVTGREGMAIVQIDGAVTEINFNYTVAENSVYFFFGASIEDCEDVCDNPNIINDEVVYSEGVPRPDRGVENHVSDGQRMLSPNGKYQMRPTKEGDLVIEKILRAATCGTDVVVTEAEPVWVAPLSRGFGKDVSYFKYQYDCNLCFVSGPKKSYWCATTGRDATVGLLWKSTKVVLTNDGRLVAVASDGTEVWASAPSNNIEN